MNSALNGSYGMEYALLIVELPLTLSGSQEQVSYAGFLSECRNYAKKEETLNHGTFLIPLKDGLLSFHHLIGAAHNYGFASRALFFEKKPDFIVTPAK